MYTRSALVLLAAFCGSSISSAAVECRVVCAGPDACLAPAKDMETTAKGIYKIASCDSGDRRTLSDASVWYSRNSIPVTKVVPKSSALAVAVADGDQRCGFTACLFNVRGGQVAGAHPMGHHSVTQTDPRVIAAGLPFEEIVVPPESLSFKVASAPGATFVVDDAAGKRYGPFPLVDGRIAVPSQIFQPGSSYIFQWTAPGGSLQGIFKVARNGTVRRAIAAADAIAPPNSLSANRKLALASAYLETGLRWNALLLFGEIERGE
ncbi:hypothetical protein [Variovorax sp. J22R115]|uniref:hypothetical protein n=1 Tax=Variovorax sp. J22R115 TaxID=3053509 RepID=UPI0025756DFD|nr:hypothetical protein [Variovorax sp. J22R115]MDM0053518.1 hypothetical protein [Variovorax sp. J22R115]